MFSHAPLRDLYNLAVLKSGGRIPLVRLWIVRPFQSNAAIGRGSDAENVTVRLKHCNGLASGNGVLEGFFRFEVRGAIHFLFFLLVGG